MPISWEQYQRGEENAAFGRWLVETIADLYGCDPTPESIDRSVYKNTDCGAWCQFDEYGILVGSIVEGSDAEFSERVDVTGLEELSEKKSKRELIRRFRATLKEIEELASEAWREANECDE